MWQDLVKYKIYEAFYLYFQKQFRQFNTGIKCKDPGAWMTELDSQIHCLLVVLNLFVSQF